MGDHRCKHNLLCIGGITLLSFNKRPHGLWCDQFHVVAKLDHLTCPVVSAATSLITTNEGGWSAINFRNCGRVSFLRYFRWPVIDAPWSRITAFANVSVNAGIHLPGSESNHSFFHLAVLSDSWLIQDHILAHCGAAWGGRKPPHLMNIPALM